MKKSLNCAILGQPHLLLAQILHPWSAHPSTSQNVLKLILKSPRFVRFGAYLTHFVAKPATRALK